MCEVKTVSQRTVLKSEGEKNQSIGIPLRVGCGGGSRDFRKVCFLMGGKPSPRKRKGLRRRGLGISHINLGVWKSYGNDRKDKWSKGWERKSIGKPTARILPFRQI